MSTPHTSKRQVTTDAIERAALALFVERGFAAVTTEQIAEAAGISVRTFFRHFPEGRDGVLLRETRRGMDVLEQALRSRPPTETAVVAMREAALDAIRRLFGPPSPDEMVTLDEATQLFRQIVTDSPGLLARMMGEGQLHLEPLVQLVALRMSVDPNTDIRPRLVVHATHAAITVAWLTVFANPELDHDTLLEEALSVLELGVDRATARLRSTSTRPRRTAHD